MKKLLVTVLAASIAQTANAQQGNTQSATAATPAAAASTSTTTAAPAAADKKLGAAFVVQASTDANGVTNLRNANYETVNYVGLTYKIKENIKLGARHYFSYNIPAEGTATGTSLDPALTISTKVKGVLGSEDIVPTMFYFAPTSDASRGIRSNGRLRVDAEADWTLNPKWTVGYFASLRQSFLPSGQQTSPKGDVTPIESSTTLIHAAMAMYSFNDQAQAYLNAGFSHSAFTLKGPALQTETANISLGAQYAFNKNFILNPEVSNDINLVKAGANTGGAAKWLQTEDLNYALTAVLTY